MDRKGIVVISMQGRIQDVMRGGAKHNSGSLKQGVYLLFFFKV